MKQSSPNPRAAAPLVSDPDHIRLAMLGMVDANGHPFSWSVILNGSYNPAPIAEAGYDVITNYLDRQPSEALGIPGASVTHVWCEDPEQAHRVSACAAIPHVVARPQDVIGQVDAVIIPTDIGGEHVERAAPFVEVGLPVFIDKPLTDNRAGLRSFEQWERSGHAFMSSSCMRYAAEFETLKGQIGDVGEVKAITVTMAKSWERYGIHALEAVYGLLPPGGVESVTNTGTPEANVVHLRRRDGVDVVLVVADGMYGGFGKVQVVGTCDTLHAAFVDSFSAFKRQLEAFVGYLRTGQRPVPWEQTREQMAIIIAGIESRERGGRRVELASILEDLTKE